MRIVGARKHPMIRIAAGEVDAIRLHAGLDGPFKSVFSPTPNVRVPSQVIVFGPLKGPRIRFRLEFVSPPNPAP